MTLSVNIMHHTSISELTKRFKCFEALEEFCFRKKENRLWLRKKKETYDLQVLFLGKTGYGKSTTVNSLIGKSVLDSDDNKPCTRQCQSVEYRTTSCGNYYLSFGDLPGIAESLKKDKAYIDIYSKFIQKTDAAVYILRADTRDYANDMKLIDMLFKSKNNKKKNNLLIGMNYCDKIEPLSRELPFLPSNKQIKNIKSKTKIISEYFNIPIQRVVPYSALSRWNLEKLAMCIFEILYQNL